MSLDTSLFELLAHSAPEGIVICDARSGDWPVVYANPAMERLTGYPAQALRGRNLRLLQADDRDQDGLAKIRAALGAGQPCQTTLRNYRGDGVMFLNETSLVPLRDAQGQVHYYAGFHREGGDRLRLDSQEPDRLPLDSQEPRDTVTQTMLAYLRDDQLTGLLCRPYFEELVKRDWGLAQRESRRVSFLVFDLDCFAQYRDVFGRAGADLSFKRIARLIGSCFRRASDLCGRFDEHQVAALATGLDLAQAAKLAEAVLVRVRDLAIHHPRSSVSRFVTASAGVVSLVPPHHAAPGRMFEAALAALRDAQDLGRNRVVSRECD